MSGVELLAHHPLVGALPVVVPAVVLVLVFVAIVWSDRRRARRAGAGSGFGSGSGRLEQWTPPSS